MYQNISNNINWLAQCQRRLKYPIDQSDRVGLTAFEYGWKSFNNIYSEFNERKDKEKMQSCIKKYIDPQSYVATYRKDLHGFCQIDHKIYLTDEQYKSLNPKLSKSVSKIRDNLVNGKYAETVNYLVDCLYIIRNARIHGALGTGKIYFTFLPKAIYSLNIEILSSKLTIPINDIESEIKRQLSIIKSEYK